MRNLLRLCFLLLPAMSLAAGNGPPGGGTATAGPGLLQALRAGGLVVAMRHARSPTTPPAADEAAPDNTQHERQLDATGHDTAVALGAALRRLQVPVGAVYVSPTYRALQTARLAGLPAPQARTELGDGGQSMQADASGTRAAWLRSLAAKAPAPGSNTWIVTHLPNLTEAFPTEAAGLADGEALVLRPDGRGGVTLLARVRIEDWPQMDAPGPSR